MKDHQPFYDAIAESPDDPAPIAIYADWLEENGDFDRAEFIRSAAYAERARDDDPLKLDHEILYLRLRERLKRRGQLKDAPSEIQYGLDQQGFRDGLIRTLGVRPSSHFNRERFEERMTATPIERLRVFSLTSTIARVIAESPLLGRVTKLSLEGLPDRFPGNAVQVLLRSPGWTSLRELSGPLGSLARDRGQTLDAWLDSFERLRLRSLFLDDAHASEGDLLDLARTRLFGQLRGLRIEGTAIPASSLKTVLGSPFLGELSELRISRGNIDDECVQALARSPKLASVRVLELSDGLITDDGIEALAQSPHARGLITLNARGNRVGDRGVRALSLLSEVGALARLDLGDNRSIRLSDLELPRRSPSRSSLLRLNLARDRVAEPGCEVLASSPWFSGLRELILNGNDLEDGINVLANGRASNSWRKLHLRSVSFSHDRERSQARAIVKSRGLANIAELDVSSNFIPYELSDALVARFGKEVVIDESRGIVSYDDILRETD